jgi:hypothetical protein
MIVLVIMFPMRLVRVSGFVHGSCRCIRMAIAST